MVGWGGAGTGSVDLAEEEQGGDHAVGCSDDVYVGDAEGWHQYHADSTKEQSIPLDQRNDGTFAILVLVDLFLIAKGDWNGSSHQAIRPAVEESAGHDANNDFCLVDLKVEGLEQNKGDGCSD